MNTNNLHELINRYESNYALFNDSEHNEVFKWRAVQQFRSVWFSDNKPADFASLFKEAKKECSNMIDNAQVVVYLVEESFQVNINNMLVSRIDVFQRF